MAQMPIASTPYATTKTQGHVYGSLLPSLAIFRASGIHSPSQLLRRPTLAPVFSFFSGIPTKKYRRFRLLEELVPGFLALQRAHAAHGSIAGRIGRNSWRVPGSLAGCWASAWQFPCVLLSYSWCVELVDILWPL